MNAETYIPRHQWSPTSLAPSEPPAPDEDEWVREAEETTEDEPAPQPHSFEQYYEYSRGLARRGGERHVFIGYAFIPHRPRGVCR